jgi:hypothetical protein
MPDISPTGSNRTEQEVTERHSRKMEVIVSAGDRRLRKRLGQIMSPLLQPLSYGPAEI